MPSNRIKPSKNQIQHIPSPEAEVMAALIPPHLAPRILKFMLEDLNSKNLPTSPIINDDIITFWNYRLIKLGEKFELNHFGPNNLPHPKNGHTFIVKYKKKWCVIANCVSDEKIIYKIPAKSIKFLDEGHDSTEINFEVEDFCRIRSAYYRSPYERNYPFRITSIRNNYVTVDPLKPPTVLRRDKLVVVDITNNKEFKIIPRGWDQNIPFSQLEIIKLKPNGWGAGPDWNDMLKLNYELGLY
jgi:hypothetical protein